MNGTGWKILSGLAFAVLFCLCFFAGMNYAHADEGTSLSASSTQERLYEQDLQDISSKLDGLAKSEQIQTVSEDVAAVKEGVLLVATHDDALDLKRAIEAIAPVDNSERLENLNKLFTGLTTVQTFQLVCNLLLIGVILALIWLVSYRSHT